MGVKSLWSLLQPVGRPLMLETIEGKSLAIDSSIWIYQFQATMRDNEGHGLTNAHVLGFLRRICKLLFYGIKPVFVFDGGAPALKRNTISERKKKKSGAALSHTKLAEKLLAAQFRREALLQAQANRAPTSKGKKRAHDGPVTINENTVYLEDIDNLVPKTPARKVDKVDLNSRSPLSSSKKRGHFHDHDPYRLPEINMEERIALATTSSAPDPRLATEEELRAFIEDMRPEDIDVNSPAFRELPTEVQYEIVGDLRLKSRQTSYKRLQNMLRKATTPLDFSKEQIKNLKQRNSLTQQLLTTTDSIGKAHITIPVRIASERNREYVLMKNEGADGGWVLGIRDDGSRAKPIEIDQDDGRYVSEDESDMEMEEVAIPHVPTFDPDLREHKQTMALSAVGKWSMTKSVQKHPPPKPLRGNLISKPLFELDDEDDKPPPAELDEDVQLAIAIQASLEDHRTVQSSKDHELIGSLPKSLTDDDPQIPLPKPSETPSRQVHFADVLPSVEERQRTDEDDDLYATPSRSETVLSLAGTNTIRTSPQRPHGRSDPLIFGRPTLLGQEDSLPSFSISEPLGAMSASSRVSQPQEIPPNITIEDKGLDIDDDVEKTKVANGLDSPVPAKNDDSLLDNDFYQDRSPSTPSITETILEKSSISSSIQLSINPIESSLGSSVSIEPRESDVEDSDHESLVDWSRSPPPSGDPSHEGSTQRDIHVAEIWDAAQEMDPQAEEGEFARFISQVRGKDLDAVRLEIDEEIRSLNHQKKAAMRDSDDITQQMISQIMLLLRLFGIPYITAPMEAEAQCAELVSLGLVEGIITDDSDVFLFGGMRVFRNMFNQSKTVECFLLADLAREFGLDRGTLIRLAYLLGSDYVEGLPGVGPVVAMELLKEFPGDDGLHKFKEWWMKVQNGRDKADDNKSKFRRRFKKKFKDLYLQAEWPNPAVRDAYYHPTVDSSEEPFKWGLPDLDALRDFIREELGWDQSKVDDLLLPIVQKMNKRKQTTSTNRQGNLNGFLDIAPGTHALRKRQTYTSKRLQQVVSDFRSEQAKLKGRQSIPEGDAQEDENADMGPAKKKRKVGAKVSGKVKTATNKSTERISNASRKRVRGGRSGKSSGRQSKGDSDFSSKRVASEEEYMGDSGNEADGVPSLEVQLRPRARPVTKGNQHTVPNAYDSDGT